MFTNELNEPERAQRSYKLLKNIITIPGGRDEEENFTFRHIFKENATNDAVFEPTKELIDSSIDGFNSTIFAYGQTGSGKTYTLQGYNEIEGIAQKSFQYLY